MVCIYKTRVYQSSYIANLLPFDIGLMTMEIPHIVAFRFSTKYALLDSVVLKDELLDKIQSAHLQIYLMFLFITPFWIKDKMSNYALYWNNLDKGQLTIILRDRNNDNYMAFDKSSRSL